MRVTWGRKPRQIWGVLVGNKLLASIAQGPWTTPLQGCQARDSGSASEARVVRDPEADGPPRPAQAWIDTAGATQLDPTSLL
jgi:hypothetical protein